MSNINVVGSGVDTLILNVRYSDNKRQPIKQELDEKLQKERKVPFGGIARQHLNIYLVYWRGEPDDAESEFVFLGAFSRPITRFAVKKMFERLNKMAAVHYKRVSANTYRHWFAVNGIKRGMPTAALRDLLGHESWSMMEVYVQLAENVLLTYPQSKVLTPS